MKRLARWLLNELTALSLLLCAATIAAWIFSYQHPWRTSIEFDKFAPNNGGYTFPNDPGTWHLFWNQRQHFFGGWYCGLGADEGALQLGITGGGTLYDLEEIGWWRVLLLWLLLPLWRSVPSQSESTISPGWQWLIRRPRIRVVSILQDFYSIFLAHCLASYLSAFILAMGWFEIELVYGDYHDPVDFLAAPLTIPVNLLDSTPDPIHSMRWAVGGCYLAALLAIYIWRTNTFIRKAEPRSQSSPAF